MIKYFPLPRRHLKTRFQQGKIFAYPTEAVFGLGCDPQNFRSVQCLLRLKKRPQHKGFVLVADCIERFSPFIAPLSFNHTQKMMATWQDVQNPCTWLVPASSHCPVWLTGKYNTLAIRVSQHPSVQALCRLFRSALISTSANLCGRKPLKSYRQCLHQFSGRSVVVQGRAAMAKKTSQIRDLMTNAIIRK